MGLCSTVACVVCVFRGNATRARHTPTAVAGACLLRVALRLKHKRNTGGADDYGRRAGDSSGRAALLRDAGPTARARGEGNEQTRWSLRTGGRGRQGGGTASEAGSGRRSLATRTQTRRPPGTRPGGLRVRSRSGRGSQGKERRNLPVGSLLQIWETTKTVILSFLSRHPKP